MIKGGGGGLGKGMKNTSGKFMVPRPAPFALSPNTSKDSRCLKYTGPRRWDEPCLFRDHGSNLPWPVHMLGKLSVKDLIT